MTAHEIVESLLDPKDEIGGMFDWKSILAKRGFTPTRSANSCEAMVKAFPQGHKLMVLGEKRDNVADRLEVLFLEKLPNEKRLVVTSRQDVDIEHLDELIKNFLLFLED